MANNKANGITDATTRPARQFPKSNTNIKINQYGFSRKKIPKHYS